MKPTYTAVIQKDGKWWTGWLEEIPGVNGQGRTRRECVASIRSALKEALQWNRAEALASAAESFEEVSLQT